MRYNKIRKMDIADGPGVRVSIFMQGCTFNCKNCFNPETHDFAGGKEFTDETVNRVLELCGNETIEGLSILGGEPMHPKNIKGTIKLAKRFEEIDAFTKLKLESKFQKLSPGGAISYVETPNLQDNLEVVIQLIKFIYDNIMYAEMNTKSDYCQVCGYTGEILIDDDLEWYCPECGNRDHDKLNVARRTCGYIGSQFWNKGRTQEIKERVLHIDNKDDE